MSRDKALSDNPGLAVYPIGEVARETGVNSVTLRAWERRYGLLQPQRTPKGHRLYTRRDIDRVLRIVRLIDQGIPVGRIRALLEGTENEQGKSEVTPFGAEFATLNGDILAACKQFHPRALGAAINRGLSTLPLDVFYRRVLEPTRMELRSLAERAELPAAVTAFFDSLVSQRLAALLVQRDTQHARKNPRVWLCGLPREDERIALLAHALACAERGLQPVALTAPIPPHAITNALHRAGAQALVLIARSPVVDSATEQALMALSSEGGLSCLVGGAAALMSEDAFSAIGFEALPSNLTIAATLIQKRVEAINSDTARFAYREDDLICTNT
ncbi:MAG: MerR family transcriptional regulator [Gammaproteobacteria bacterium]